MWALCPRLRKVCHAFWRMLRGGKKGAEGGVGRAYCADESYRTISQRSLALYGHNTKNRKAKDIAAPAAAIRRRPARLLLAAYVSANRGRNH